MDSRGDLERRLRRSLADEATRARPSGTDLAARAVRAGRRAAALRGASGLVAVIAATLVAGGILLPSDRFVSHPPGGVTQILPPPPASASRPPAGASTHLPRGLPVGVIGETVEGGLVLTAGPATEVPLRPVTGVISAYPVGDGWAVVTGGDDRSRLWWVSRHRGPVLVLSGLDALAVDHSRVAWRRGQVLSAGTLSDTGKLEQRVDTEVSDERTDPVGFVGATVLLGHIGADGLPAGWDTWRPDRGAYLPTWTTDVTWVFGALPDGETAVGLVFTGGRQCLALLDLARELDARRRVCPPGPPPRGPAAVSPDGRWLLGSAGDRAAPVLVDLPAAFAGAPDATTKVSGVPPPAGRPVWVGSGTVLYPAAGTLVQIWPDRVVGAVPQQAETVTVAGTPVVLFELV